MCSNKYLPHDNPNFIDIIISQSPYFFNSSFRRTLPFFSPVLYTTSALYHIQITLSFTIFQPLFKTKDLFTDSSCSQQESLFSITKTQWICGPQLKPSIASVYSSIFLCLKYLRPTKSQWTTAHDYQPLYAINRRGLSLPWPLIFIFRQSLIFTAEIPHSSLPFATQLKILLSASNWSSFVSL